MMNTLNGRWAFDTHIFVYSFDNTSPFYAKTKELFRLLLTKQLQAVITPQNAIEFENVLTKVNKKPLSEVISHLNVIIANFEIEVVHPLTSTFRRYHELIKSKKKVPDLFDYYLAATLLDNRVNHLLTVNTKDFVTIPDFEVLNPFVR